MQMRMAIRYRLLTVLYLAVIYGLSSLPDLSAADRHPLLALATNLAHVPVFAGLAFCIVRSLPPRLGRTVEGSIAAFAVCVGLAALDEWHQSFVRGRIPSSGDLLLDVVGIAGMLFVLRVRQFRPPSRCEAE